MDQDPSSSIFGTDGVRGTFGAAPIDHPTLHRLAAAVARKLAATEDRPLVVIGGDTRASTPTVSAWLSAALREHGADVVHAGVAPTPAVAYLTRRLAASAGIAVSASHNPHTDNGVKLFDRHGFKWSVEAEAEIETLMATLTSTAVGDVAAVERSGHVVDAWVDSLLTSLGGQRLDGLAVVLDTANGAAFELARRVFECAGATVDVIGDRPDGHNINVACGSTDTAALSERTRGGDATLGFAFDGDADRCLVVDEAGRALDGDAALYLWARELAATGELSPREIVVTTMSNLGLEVSLAEDGIAISRCGVGDREVVTEMRRRGVVLGGEQSGHLVHLGLATTGDGVLTALQIAAIVHRGREPISSRVAGLHLFPQVLHNVRVAERVPLAEVAGLPTVMDRIASRLGHEGRVLVRYSGTEPLARIMIEGRERPTIQAMAEEIAACLRADRRTGVAG